MSTEPLEENKGDIMLPPQVVDFAADALASMGGTYTGEIEFSGGSARALRRLSRGTSQVQPFSKSSCRMPLLYHLTVWGSIAGVGRGLGGAWFSWGCRHL